MVAEIFHSVATEFASLVGAVEPGDSDACAHAQAACAVAELLDNADDLMAGNHGRLSRRQFAFDHVQIGAANAATIDAHQHFAFPRLRNGDIGEFERIRSNRRRLFQNASLHIQTFRALDIQWMRTDISLTHFMAAREVPGVVSATAFP